MINEEINYESKITNFNKIVGNNNVDIALEFLQLANWDENQAIKLYLNNVSLPSNTIPYYNDNKFNYIAECQLDLNNNILDSAFSFLKSTFKITEDNSDCCKVFEGRIRGLVKDPNIFMSSLKINKGIIILYNKYIEYKLLIQLNIIDKEIQNNNLYRIIIFPVINSSKEGSDIIKQLSIYRFPCYLFCKYKSEKTFYVVDKMEGIFELETFKNIICPYRRLPYNSVINGQPNYNKKNVQQNIKNHYISSINLNNNYNLSYPNNLNNKIDNKNEIKEIKNNNNNLDNDIKKINNNNQINEYPNFDNNLSFPKKVNNSFSLLNSDNEIDINNIVLNENEFNNLNENKNPINNNANNNNSNIKNNNFIQNNKSNNEFNYLNNNNLIKNNNIKNNNNNNNSKIRNNDIIQNNNNNVNKNNNINNNSIKSNNFPNNNISITNNNANKGEAPPKTEKKVYIPDYRDYDLSEELPYYPEIDQFYSLPNINNLNNNYYNNQNNDIPMSDGDIIKNQDYEMKKLEKMEEERIKKEKEEKEKKRIEEKKEKQKLEEEKEQKEMFSKIIPSEPDDNNPDKCIIIFRLPDGEKNIERKFLKTDKISVLYDYIRSIGREIYTEEEYNNFSIIQTFPFKNFEEKINNTLEEEGLYPNAMLQIKEIN